MEKQSMEKQSGAEKEFYFCTEGMTVGYNGRPLIRDIGIRLKRGEILTLIGPNGAGKTTILKSIIRQLSLIGGTVYLDGRDMAGLSGSALARKLSVVLTERARPELMSCEEVAATGRYPYTGRFGVLSEEDRRIIRECMELVHVSDIAGQDFSTTSDGQRQRVMLARALCQEPEIIVLDEPTSFLDVRYKVEFMSVLQHMARARRLSVIMSLHELDLAERVSDRILCVKGDKVDRYGTAEEIFTPGYIRKLYGMTSGTWEEQTGSLELERPSGEPRVFVIAGNGGGTPVYRKLQREGTPFATGILWENDLDYPAARALAAEVVSVRAFAAAGPEQVKRAKALMDRCRVISALPGELTDEPERLPQALREVVEYARSLGHFFP